MRTIQKYITWVVVSTLFLIFILACEFLSKTIPSETSEPSNTSTTSTTTFETNSNLPTATVEPATTAQAAKLLTSIRSDLKLAGFDMDKGQLAFVQAQPVEIEANTPSAFIHLPLTDPNPVLSNFALGADIQLDMNNDIASYCEILFRSEDDFESGEKAVFSTGLSQGFTFWHIDLQVGHGQKDDWVRTSGEETHETDDDIDIKTGIHYLLVAEDATLTVYANGQRRGTAPITVANKQGVIFLQTYQDNGLTTCTFSNIWVWELP